MKTLSLKLPESLLVKMTAAAKKRGETRSSLARQAIEAFIKQDKPSEKNSCLDLAKDLAGCVDGPEDLSSNRDYFQKYGQ